MCTFENYHVSTLIIHEQPSLETTYETRDVHKYILLWNSITRMANLHSTFNLN